MKTYALFSLLFIAAASANSDIDLNCQNSIGLRGTKREKITIKLDRGFIEAQVFHRDGRVAAESIAVKKSISRDNHFVTFRAKNFSLRIEKNDEAEFIGSFDAKIGSKKWNFPIVCEGKLK